MLILTVENIQFIPPDKARESNTFLEIDTFLELEEELAAKSTRRAKSCPELLYLLSYAYETCMFRDVLYKSRGGTPMDTKSIRNRRGPALV